MSKFVTINWVK